MRCYPEILDYTIDYFQRDCDAMIVTTEYEFQKGDNKLLIIRK